MTIITPYDNKVALWYHKGQTVAEQNIDQLAQTICRYAPSVSQVFVKTSDGTDWMGKFDNKPGMAINGPADIQRWITTLQKYGLEFHAWAVPRGLNIDGEANILTQTAQVAGVRSLILDVEPYENFFTGGRSAIRPLMSRIRSQIPGAFHIGMAVDPRSTQYAPIFPDEWFPFVNSVLLQLYWVTFQVTPDQALANGYKTWGSYNRPVFPILQGYKAGAAQMDQARTLATSTYKSNGLSWWVLGQMNADDLSAANKYVNGQVGVVAPGADGSTPNYGAAITVSVGGPGYSDGAFPDIH